METEYRFSKWQWIAIAISWAIQFALIGYGAYWIGGWIMEMLPSASESFSQAGGLRGVVMFIWTGKI